MIVSVGVGSQWGVTGNDNVWIRYMNVLKAIHDVGYPPIHSFTAIIAQCNFSIKIKMDKPQCLSFYIYNFMQ